MFQQVFLITRSDLQNWRLTESEQDRVCVMADKEDQGLDLPYKNLLVLGAIAAASAFVVTILIVLVCVGCQR